MENTMAATYGITNMIQGIYAPVTRNIERLGRKVNGLLARINSYMEQQQFQSKLDDCEKRTAERYGKLMEPVEYETGIHNLVQNNEVVQDGR